LRFGSDSLGRRNSTSPVVHIAFLMLTHETRHAVP
jgi:hypothetical protein